MDFNCRDLSVVLVLLRSASASKSCFFSQIWVAPSHLNGLRDSAISAVDFDLTSSVFRRVLGGFTFDFSFLRFLLRASAVQLVSRCFLRVSVPPWWVLVLVVASRICNFLNNCEMFKEHTCKRTLDVV